MKKIFAIAMLLLLLFNVGGYQLLFQYFIYQSDNAITKQINNNHYKPADLIEIKIPVQLNIQNWDCFEPIGGQIKVKDNIYNYAQLKMTRDTMYLMCIPNHDKARIVTANVVYAKQVNDITPSAKKSSPSSIKKGSVLGDYNYYAMHYRALTLAAAKTPIYGYSISNTIKANLPVYVLPPEAYAISI